MPGRSASVTIADVARRAGVSRALVSIVLRGVPGASPENRERVLRVAAELGYHPDQRARLLGSGRSRTVGVVFGLQEPFHGELVEALYGAASGSGWRLSLQPRLARRPEPAAVRELLAERVETVLLLGSGLDRRELTELGERVPVVLLARSLAGGPAVPGVGTVRTDDQAGAELAVRHLLGLGHRHVAHVHGRKAPGAVERRRGYRDVLRAAGLEPDLVGGGTTGSSGEAAARELLGRDAAARPTAVLAFNDESAAGLLQSVRAAHLAVPGDLSVVGFDDSAVASLDTVALTTVGQNAGVLAARAFEQATRRAEQEAGAQDVVIAPELVVRRTTAPPR